MNFLIVPEHVRVDVRFSVDSELLALLQSIVDQGNDRAAAKALSADVKANTAALAAVVTP